MFNGYSNFINAVKRQRNYNVAVAVFNGYSNFINAVKRQRNLGLGLVSSWSSFCGTLSLISQLIYDDILSHSQNVSSDSRKWLIKHLFPPCSWKKQINKQNSYFFLPSSSPVPFRNYICTSPNIFCRVSLYRIRVVSPRLPVRPGSIRPGSFRLGKWVDSPLLIAIIL